MLEDLLTLQLLLFARWTEGLGIPPATTNDVSQVTQSADFLNGPLISTELPLLCPCSTTPNFGLFPSVTPFTLAGRGHIKMEAAGAKCRVVWGQKRLGTAGPETPARRREVWQKHVVRDSPCLHACPGQNQAGLRASAVWFDGFLL